MNQITKLAVVSLVSSVSIISLQEAALGVVDTYHITFKGNPLDIKCNPLDIKCPLLPTIYSNTDNLNLEVYKEGELEDSLGVNSVLTYDVFNKKGVLLDVLPFSNNT